MSLIGSIVFLCFPIAVQPMKRVPLVLRPFGQW